MENLLAGPGRIFMFAACFAAGCGASDGSTNDARYGVSGTAGMLGVTAGMTAGVTTAGVGVAGTQSTAGTSGPAAGSGNLMGTAGIGEEMAGISGGFAGMGAGIEATAGMVAAGAGAGTGVAGISAAGSGAAGTGEAGSSAGMSTGCGMGSWPDAGTKTVDISGTQRSYIIALPSGYDSSKPYKLVFAWHYLGGTASGIASGGYYSLQSRAANSTIFVAPQGIDNAWPNTGGRDVAFTQEMLDFMRENYCVDQDRIFSVGFSYGAIMSNTAGCAFGDVFRAIAPMAGSGPRSTSGCKGQVAAWLSHGTSDTTVSFSSGQNSRDHWVAANHCASTSKSVGSCIAYDGCDAGFPVHWCEFSGGHTRPSFAPDAIWAFFSMF